MLWLDSLLEGVVEPPWTSNPLAAGRSVQQRSHMAEHHACRRSGRDDASQEQGVAGTGMVAEEID